MDNEYKRICNKLGCKPSEVIISDSETEDDNWKNPFSVLSVEEIDYLYENGYMNQE